MKQNVNTINLKQIMDDFKLVGESANEGKVLYNALVSHIDKHPQYNVFYIDVNSAYFNASFAREGIVKVAKNYRMKKGICLVNVEDEDSLDNILGPVAKLEQPIPYYIHSEFRLIGHKKIGIPSKTNLPIFNYMLLNGLSTANEVAEKFQLKLSNASTKLKALFEEGFVLREEKKSSSGGIEFFYYVIK